MENKITARMVFEILGRPAEHVKETLNTLVIKIGSEDGVKIVDKKYHDPAKVEKSKDLFTTFAEVEMEFESLNRLFGILVGYFPSNLEIISPMNLKLKNEELSELANQVINRLHNYDAISKKLLNENKIILGKLQEKGINLKELFGQPEEKKEDEKKINKETRKSKSSKKKEKVKKED